MNCFSTWRLVMVVAGLLLVMQREAQAYIDPGSTSYFFQLLIGGLTAVVFFFSSLKRRVAGFFKKKDPVPNVEPVPGKMAPPEP